MSGRISHPRAREVERLCAPVLEDEVFVVEILVVVARSISTSQSR
jgi:hypothetical protein